MTTAISWSTLRNYESRDLIKLKYKAIHGGDASTAQAREISCAFTQGREYFASATSADPIVRPLLLFYGVQSLARGSTMLLLPKMREANLQPSHGLSETRWHEELTKDRFDVGELLVQVKCSGTLYGFAQATKNSSLLRIESSVPTKAWVHDMWASPFDITLKDILLRMPELSQQCKRWNSSLLHCHVDVLQPLREGATRLSIPKAQYNRVITIQDISKVFAGWSDQSVIEQHEDFWVTGPSMTSPGFWDCVSDNFLGIGELFCIAKHGDAQHLSKSTALYMLSYFLGMLVRYFPSAWMTMVRNENSDAILPTLLDAVSLIENRFPIMIADFLEWSRPEPA